MADEVEFVLDILPARTPDPVIAEIGDRLSAIVVTWDKDFRKLVKRIPEGNRTAFRRLGRITFRRQLPIDSPDCRDAHL